MRNWTARCTLFSAFLLAGAASADTEFGVYVGYGSWHHDSQGKMQSGTTAIDVEDDIQLGDDQDDIYFLTLEHTIPFVPNVRAQHSSVTSSGLVEAQRTLDFSGLTIQPPTAVESHLSVRQTDLILYYQILDSDFSWDLGFGAREVKGKMQVGTSLVTETEAFDETIPVVYTAIRMQLLGGWWASGDAVGIAYDNNSLFDANVKLGWRSPWGVGLEAGYKWMQFQLDDVGAFTEADVEFHGPYAALNYQF